MLKSVVHQTLATHASGLYQYGRCRTHSGQYLPAHLRRNADQLLTSAASCTTVRCRRHGGTRGEDTTLGRTSLLHACPVAHAFTVAAPSTLPQSPAPLQHSLMETVVPSPPRGDAGDLLLCPLHPDVDLEPRFRDESLFLCRADLWEAANLMLAMCPEKDVASLIHWRHRMETTLNPVPFGCFTQRGLLLLFTSAFHEPTEQPSSSVAMNVFVQMLDAVVDCFWSRLDLQKENEKYPICTQHTPTTLACGSCVSNHPFYDGAQ